MTNDASVASAHSLSLSLSLPPNFQKIFPRRRRSVDGIGMLPAMRQGTTLVSGTQFSEDIARGYNNSSIQFKTAQLRKKLHRGQRNSPHQKTNGASHGGVGAAAKSKPGEESVLVPAWLSIFLLTAYVVLGSFLFRWEKFE